MSFVLATVGCLMLFGAGRVALLRSLPRSVPAPARVATRAHRPHR